MEKGNKGKGKNKSKDHGPRTDDKLFDAISTAKETLMKALDGKECSMFSFFFHFSYKYK